MEPGTARADPPGWWSVRWAFDGSRGDQISLQVFDFTGAVPVEPPASSWLETPYWQDSLRYLVGGLLGLTLVFFASVLW
ncbi:hypothetical protein [Aeromonas caviae]|uniref:hypothetical protein n=1 Tax=Aeromonas caviae TaxID=648 RepID=UPI000A6EBE9E